MVGTKRQKKDVFSSLMSGVFFVDPQQISFGNPVTPFFLCKQKKLRDPGYVTRVNTSGKSIDPLHYFDSIPIHRVFL